MTELLYYTEPGLYQFTAKITGIQTVGKRTAVILDRTTFYPEGGGQPADTGRISGLEVVDVQKNGDDVLHFLSSGDEGASIPSMLPEKGTEAECQVDMEHRLDYMQQHTGQHVISAALAASGIATVSVHQGEEFTTIETDADEIADDILLQAEDETNRVIRAGVPVLSHWTDSEGLKNFRLRRPSKHSSNIRIIEIPGVDTVACGGLHLASTAEIGLIKYIKQEKIRGHIRTFWKIGSRAYRDYHDKTLITSRLTELHSARQHELVTKCSAALETVKDLKYRLGRQQEEYAALYAEKLAAAQEGKGPVKLIIEVFEDKEPDDIGNLIKALASLPEKAVSFVFNRTADKITWAACVSENCGSADFDFNSFKKEILPIAGGKGGGRPPMWQGVLQQPAGMEKMLSELENAYDRNSLL